VTIAKKDKFFQDTKSAIDQGATYQQYFYAFAAKLRPSTKIGLGVWTGTGDDIDFENNQAGKVFIANPYLTWNINKHIELYLNYHYTALDVQGGRKFTANVSDIRFNYQFNNQYSLRFTLQYNNTKTDTCVDGMCSNTPTSNRSLGTQLLYSYKVSPLTALHIGYSDHAKDNGLVSELTKDSQSIFFKFSYEWQPN